MKKGVYFIVVLHADTCEPKELIGYRDTKTKKYSGGLLQKTFSDDQLIVRHLPTADYALWDQCGHSLGIERKRGGDLTSSLSSRHKQANGNVRLLNQLVRLKDEYTHPALLLEGDQSFLVNEDGGGYWGLDGAASGWNWLSVQMMLWGWEQDGLKVFWIPSSKDIYGKSNYRPLIELLRGLNQRAEAGCVLKGIRVKKTK